MNSEVVVQQQPEADTSTVTTHGGKSGYGFGRGAHISGSIPHE
jgi:hypothetical protein